jgi:hypothetical protein
LVRKIRLKIKFVEIIIKRIFENSAEILPKNNDTLKKITPLISI